MKAGHSGIAGANVRAGDDTLHDMKRSGVGVG